MSVDVLIKVLLEIKGVDEVAVMGQDDSVGGVDIEGLSL